MIYNKYFENGINEKLSDTIEKVKNRINGKNIVFIILSFILSMQSINTKFAMMNFVVMALASLFNVPLILVLISSFFGLAISSITTSMVIKLLVFFGIFTLITSLVNIEGINKKNSVFIKFIISIMVVEFGSAFINSTIFTDIFEIVGNILVASSFYFIFASGVYLALNYSSGYVYSKEESISLIALITIMLIPLYNVSIFNFSVFNILVLVLVLIYGWKSGAVLGGIAGFIIGLMLTVVTGASMTYVVSLGVSGIVAGIFSKFGKVAIVISFILGNVYLSYYTDGLSEMSIYMSEILVSSLSILLMPKRIEHKISNLFNKNKTLANPYENVLDVASELKNKVGAISSIFDELSNISLSSTPEEKEESKDIIKKYIYDYVENRCVSCSRQCKCLNSESFNISIDYIVEKLENGDIIDNSMFPFECDSKEDIISNIKEAYDGIKLVRILKKKEIENNEKISNQYKEVSKILSNISKNIKSVPIIKDKDCTKLREELKFYGYTIYEDDFERKDGHIEYTFVTDILNNIDKQKKEIVEIASNILEQKMKVKLILNSSKKEKSRIKIISMPEFEVNVGIASSIKSGETVSGDSYISMELEDSKHLVVVSDGAGSGISASKSSNALINMLEKLLNGGFDEKKAIEIINSILKMKSVDNDFSTLDSLIVNLKNGEAEFIKVGAAPTYIIEDGKITTVNNINIPVGILDETMYLPILKKLSDGAIIVQVSDGVIKDGVDINSNYLTRYLQNIDKEKSPKQLVDELQRLVEKEYSNVFDDDITIIVTKLKKSA